MVHSSVVRLLAFLTLVSLFAASPPGARLRAASRNWDGEWISLPSAQAAEKPNVWCCFRKSFSLTEKPPEQAVARIACDSKYWLWVNGKLTVFEGQLKRGPTPQDTYFDRVDLAPHLKQGENVLAILVWHFGKQGMSHKDSGKLGLLLEADIDQQKIASDDSWKVRIHPAYGDTGEPHPNWRLPESNIRFDAGQDLGSWQEATFDSSSWDDAAVIGKPPCPPWNQLVERPTPLWRFGQIQNYENDDELPSSSSGEPLVAKLPYNAQVTPYLKIDAPAGKVIDIRTDNYRGGSEFNVRAEYVTTDGIQEFEALGWMNGHDVRYNIPRGIQILELGYRESGYDADFAGAFHCDNDALNLLWKKCQRTLYVNMRDTYFDCPDRERSQWWGDVTIQLHQSFYALDPRSHALSRKGILELANWQRDDGTIFSPVPAGNWNNELPMQMLASVGRYGFWTYYQHTSDTETIHAVYPNVRRYVIDVWQLGDDGLVAPREGGWTWGDWGENKDMPLLYNGWYCLALDGLTKMAEVVGNADDVAECQRRRTSLREHFNSTFWLGSQYRSRDYQGKTDDRGHALAVVAGLAEAKQYPAIREVLKRQRHASPYMEKYVLEALYQMGYPDDAVGRMNDRYRPMVESPLTTLWEGWGIGAQGFGGGSYNHAWSGGPLILLSQRAAGIRPTAPGYSRYEVLPQMGDLARIEATVHSVKGVIDVVLKKGESQFELELLSPTGAVASIGVPAEYQRIVEINGDVVWSAGKSKELAAGIESVQRDGNYIKAVVAPGSWRVRAQR